MRTAALALLAVLLVVGCSNEPVPTPTPPTTGPQDAYVAEVLARSPAASQLPTMELVRTGRNACGSIGTVGVTENSLADTVGRQLGIIAVGEVVVAAASRFLCPDREFDDGPLPPFDLVGSISLQDPDGHVPGPGGLGCQGDGGYSDLRPGGSVTVQDATGTVIALGILTVGAPNGVACDMYFEVTDVPSSPFYQIEVTNRGTVTFTEEQARGGEAMLTIGG